MLNLATSSESYTVYIDPDLRLDVARVQTKPADGNQDIYMWIQAVQGFFVLHQDLSLGDEFFRLLQEWQKVESPPLDNNQTGD